MDTQSSAGTILVVDRNREKRDQLCRILSDEGHRVVVAEDGDSAVTASREHRPSLVLLDSVVPGADGEAVLHTLRKKMRDDTPPAFLLTASRSEEESAGELGAVASFFKPFAVEDLLGAIRSFVDRLASSAT